MNPSEELKQEMQKKFLCQDKFAQEIETLVQKNPEYNYINAIVEYCDKNNIDIETVPKLISKPLKEKLKWDAVQLNFLKKTSRAKLPL
jgi:hypothetical protein